MKARRQDAPHDEPIVTAKQERDFARDFFGLSEEQIAQRAKSHPVMADIAALRKAQEDAAADSA